MTVISKRISGAVAEITSKRLSASVTETTSRRVTATASGGATKRVPGSVSGGVYRAWGSSWMASWGNSWDVYPALSLLGLSARVTGTASGGATRRVTGT